MEKLAAAEYLIIPLKKYKFYRKKGIAYVIRKLKKTVRKVGFKEKCRKIGVPVCISRPTQNLRIDTEVIITYI